MPHLLRRLELNGFKSFAQKTVLEFPEGITAIVGPNGSGKSNVIDAIRWLLGERDSRNLRGGKGEDLIFAGTPKKPRLGQAQASLHFDNGENFFPLNVSEVTVTRQVNRDGTNAYFLNKAEVRLKDVQDFFAKARLGSRGLTVITQGNSDMFIRATSLERREMIEEILGLREYQLKRADAERRLKNANLNLDKVRALIEELAPHLRSLKRQTSRWEKRGEIEAELKRLEDQFFGAQYHEFTGGLLVIEREIIARGDARKELEQKKISSEVKVREIEANAPHERARLKELKGEMQTLRAKRSDLEKSLGRIEAEIELSSRHQESSIAPSEAVIMLKKVRDELARMIAHPEEIAVHVTRLLMEIDESFGVKKNNMTSAEAERRNTLFAETKKAVEEVLLSAGKLEAEEAALEKNAEQFYATFKDAVSELETAKTVLERFDREIQDQQLRKERLVMRKEEWEGRVRQAGRRPEEFASSEARASVPVDSSFEQRMFRLRGDLASMGEVDTQVVQEAQTTEERHQFLTQQSADLEKAQTDLRALMKDLGEKIHIEFKKAMIDINREFENFFGLMFGGGQAKLKVQKLSIKNKNEETENEQNVEEAQAQDESEEGIEVEVSLPRKRISSLEMLSGGERSLVGIAALFALISVSPPPFLVLDEIDAPLDERNARRFGEMLRSFAKHTQFIVVTHNRATMEAANVLYGVTLNEDGTSKILSVNLGV